MNENLPAIRQSGLPMSAEQIRDHVNAIQKVMEAVMKKEVHYGVVPGSKKPSLYKPGAETLCKTFHIEPSFQVEDLSTNDYYRYRVRCVGVHQGSGVKLGEGMGACSSNEEKYKWRRSICPEEFDATPESRRRIKFSKYQGKLEKTMQVRAEPDDIDNTILKMACKRSLIAMTLNVVAASDIFAQDVEDIPEHLRDQVIDGQDNAPVVSQPRSKTAAQQTPASASTGDDHRPSSQSAGAAVPMKPSQVNIVKAKLRAAGLTEVDLEAQFPGKSLEPKADLAQFTLLEFNDITKWISEKTA